MRFVQEKDIYPLRDSFFEGFPVKIPFEYGWLLEEEYGRTALTVTQYQQYACHSYASLESCFY